jgi:iron complex outermembrane receptor protein
MTMAAAARTGIQLAVAGLLSAATVSAQGAPPAAVPNLEALDLEQLMEIEVVVAASKRSQPTGDVPSSVSIVTAAEIKAHGYRTLADVLKTVAGFYISNDRNYSFVGVRGFERPGDYNSRVLLLVNGLRTNDPVYDASGIGEEFLVDIDLIERVEVIRGPSAAIYGSNAFFAVINVVTRAGASLQGAELAASGASFGTWAGRASYGKSFATGLDVLVSASLSDSVGRRLYFPEYDDPSTHNGISEGADGERSRKLLATVSKGSFSFQASSLSREKHIPTGAYGTVFADPRTKTVDALNLASLSYNRSFSSGSSLTARVHGGSWLYEGDYPYAPELDVSRDEDYGEWWGADVDGTRRFGRHFLTVGGEYRDNYRQDLRTLDREPLVVYTDLKSGSKRWGAFVQDEIKLMDPLTLYAGLRYDRYESFGSMVSPRAGLIYRPDSATTVKLLAGRAFRAPSEFELYYESSDYAPNPGVRPERIETLELVAQRVIGGRAQFTVAAFQNRLSALVTQFVGADGRLVFENVGDIESKGIEFGLRVNRGHGPTGQATYSIQRTVDRATDVRLSNSPGQMADLEILAPLGKRLSAGLDAQYVSRRRTIRGNTARSYTLTNLSLLAPRILGHFDVSATVYNLFDVEYGVPWGEDVLQEIIQQDGRSFRVKTTLRF